MTVEIIFWIVSDFIWEQKRKYSMVETRLGHWVGKWARERGHVSIRYVYLVGIRSVSSSVYHLGGRGSDRQPMGSATEERILTGF